MKTRLHTTRQRKVILEELEKTRRHPTADELFQAVRRRLPRISLGTVYRNLELMSAQGLINKLNTFDGPARFDFNTHQHHHFFCLHCGGVTDLEVECDELKVKTPRGYQVQGCQIEFKGLCPDCRKKGKPASGPRRLAKQQTTIVDDGGEKDACNDKS